MGLRDKILRLRQSHFLRSVSVLVGGTALAQALMVMTLPVMVRLYSPEDFSALAVFAALISVVAVAACLRFDVAIALPELDDDAANLLALALVSAVLISALAALLLWLMPGRISAMLGQPKLQPYLWVVPLGILLASSCSALQFWAMRKKEFVAIARTKMAQVVVGLGVQVGLGGAGVAPLGLLLGQAISSGAGAIGLSRRAFRVDRRVLASIRPREMYRMFRAHDRFPKYSAVEALANSASVHLPIVMIAALAIGPEAGFLMLAMRAIQAPMGLIGGAVAQVYMSRAPSEHRAGRLALFTAGTLGGLMATGVGPLIFAGIVAPEVFTLIFGTEWRRAGELVSWMAPWFAMQFLASPVAMTLHVTNNQRTALALQLFGVLLRVGAVLIAAETLPARITESYAISGFVFYLVYVALVAQMAGMKMGQLVREIESAVPTFAFWTILAILVKYSFQAFR